MRLANLSPAMAAVRRAGMSTIGAAILVFPEQLAKDGPLFDKLIEDVRLASEAKETSSQFRRRGVRTIEQHYKRDLYGAEEVAPRRPSDLPTRSMTICGGPAATRSGAMWRAT